MLSLHVKCYVFKLLNKSNTLTFENYFEIICRTKIFDAYIVTHNINTKSYSKLYISIKYLALGALTKTLFSGHFFPIYSASKCAVLGFSQSLASMYDKTGVRVIIMCPGFTATALIININSKVCDSIRPIVTNEIASVENMPKQTSDNVALGVLNLIQKGKNGATWIIEGDQPPYAVNFPHYSKRCTPV